VPPHHGAPGHIHHREDEAFYILEGEFEIECGARSSKQFRAHSRCSRRVSRTDSRTWRINRAKFYACSPPVESRNSSSTCLLAEAGPPDPNKMKELADKYEIEFLLPPR